MKRGDFDFDSAQLNAWVEHAAASPRLAEKDAAGLRNNPIFRALIEQAVRRRLSGSHRLAPFREESFAKLLLKTSTEPKEIVEAIEAYLRLEAKDFYVFDGKEVLVSDWREKIGWLFWMIVFASPAFIFLMSAYKEYNFYEKLNYIVNSGIFCSLIYLIFWLIFGTKIVYDRKILSYFRQVRLILLTNKFIASNIIKVIINFGIVCVEFLIGLTFLSMTVALGFYIGAIVAIALGQAYGDPKTEYIGWSTGILITIHINIGCFWWQFHQELIEEKKLLTNFIAAWRKKERLSQAQSPSLRNQE
jgi:hypothetical protein